MSTAEVCRGERACHVQATIAARIDRLDPEAKRTLERSGGHRLAVQPGPAGSAGRSILSSTIWWRPS